ncbi:MAG TPA: tetratricopeptide repeat protein [Myxococcales bacterium]
MLALFIAAAIAQPGRDPTLLHRHTGQVVAEKEQEQEAALRRMLQLGGSPAEQAEVLGRLAAVLRGRGLALGIRAQAEADQGDEAAAANDRRAAADARAEAVARYRERLKKFPDAPRTDEALFFLADTLQDSGRDQEAVAAARELTRRFPRSQWAPASHVFIGEHLFDQAKLDAALKEYRAAAEVKDDEVYPYALYKAAWCRFNQSAFADAMKLLHRVVQVSEKSGDVNTVQLAREARRDYVLAYARIGKPEAARDEFARVFGAGPGLKMLEQYGKLLFDTGRDPEAQLVHRQLLALHGDNPAAALDQTRLLMLAQRGGKRRDLLVEAQRLVDTFRRVRKDDKDDSLDEANRRGEETLRNLAVQIHNEARKTHLDETWAAARALYGDYLALFPDAPDAYDLRYFYGELLYSRGFKAEAAEQYEEVVKHDLAARTPGRWLQKAAWSAVLSRNEAMLHGGAEEKDTGERRTQRALSKEEQSLAAACNLYLKALPDGPHAVEVAFKVGRLEYLSSQYDAASKHLSFIALNHPEHELAEYAANLVLDIENLRGNWKGVHAWALRFLGDRKLTAHGSLLQDLRRIEEQSAYAMAEAVPQDAQKASALLAFVQAHPHGQLADKALFGAAAALSRAGQLDAALAARARVWKEQPQSPLVPRALLASASDLAAVGDLGEAASLLEKYAAGFQKEQAARKWRAAHPPKKTAKKPEPERPSFEEAKAQVALHDAAVLREARGELRQALNDRTLSLQLWKSPADRDEQLFAQAKLRAGLGEISRAAREMAGIARAAKQNPSLQLTAWREAARLFARVHESGNAQWSWTEAERAYRSLSQKARESLSPVALAAAAEAHFALGQSGFESFRKQEIRQPLMATLNRKIALLQAVRKRAEETVAMRQAEPAVCALAQLGEAQMMLGQAIATSPYPPGLNAEQRKLYRDALAEKAQPLSVEARETLKSADARARDLGVNGPCAQRVGSLLEKLAAKAADRPKMSLARSPVLDTPEMVDGRAVQGERARRLLEEALAAAKGLEPAQALEKFQAVAQAEPSPATRFDLAVALDRAGRGQEAEQEYRAAAAAKGVLGYEAAARAASLAAARGDAEAARSALSLSDAALPGIVAGRVLRAELELTLGNAVAAQAAAKSALAQAPSDVRALCAMARAALAQGQPGAARIFAARAEKADATDPEPLLVKGEIARAANEPADELAAVRAAVEAAPDAPQAQLALGRALYERGDFAGAADALADAVDLDPASYPAALAYGQALAQAGQAAEARQALERAVALAPRAPEPHLELARLELDGDGDAQSALREAKLFLSLSTTPPPPGHPVHALVQRCEEALRQASQASVVQTK